MDKVFDNLNNTEDVINLSLSELKDSPINLDIAKLILKSRGTTLKRGVENNANIRFNKIGVVTVHPNRLQRYEILQQLKLDNPKATKDELKAMLNDEIKRLGKAGLLNTDKMTKVNKKVK